ncbi:meiotic recombination protein SPO11-like, partial [Rhopilema esculentum]|uniref:meiotic recombination protein SPO11-like n=1 Tax=Rhopilema esculentum TaxID=499914 RepID=UPI0031D15E06
KYSGEFVFSSYCFRDEILTKIECLVKNMLEDLANGKPMKFVFNKRGHDASTRFNQRVGLQMEEDAQMTVVSLEKECSINKFSVMLRALSLCYQLLQTDSYTTKRDLYYTDKNIFGTQQVVDEAFNDIACMLQIPRNSLHVLASPKGIVIGNLVFRDNDDNFIDCSQSRMGTMVPSRVDEIHDFYSKARFVLLVEKEASFQKLNDSNVISKLGPCIMITAKGFPDINTRIFLRKIWENLKIPILALMDADPHGIEIMCVYRFGSKSLTFDSENLTCPSIRWLGVLPSDIERMGIPSEVLINTTDSDLKKMSDLLKRPYIQSNREISNQIERMMDQKLKAEIECLEAVSTTFATDIYLPSKIRSGDWL